jgi:hypothetical protein
MTPQQIKNVATGFVRVLAMHPDVYDAWVPVAKTGNASNIGKFVQGCMYLESAPTEVEIEAMDEHLGSAMQQDVAAFRQARPDAPMVLAICGEEHGD